MTPPGSFYTLMKARCSTNVLGAACFSNSHLFIKTWFIFFYGIVCLGLSSGLQITLHTGQFIWKWNWIKYFFYIKHTCVWYMTSAVKMYLPGYVVMKKKIAEMCWTCPQWPCQDVAWMVEVRGWFATPASLVMSSLNNRRVPHCCCCVSRNHCVRISWNIPNSNERKRHTGRQKKSDLFSFSFHFSFEKWKSVFVNFSTRFSSLTNYKKKM